jgi:hypothetical protein
MAQYHVSWKRLNLPANMMNRIQLDAENRARQQ